MSDINALIQALPLVRAIWTDPVTGVFAGLKSQLPGGVSWRVPVLDAPRKLPAVIVTPMTQGAQDPYIGTVGWQGLVMLKTLGTTQDAADAALQVCIAAVPRNNIRSINGIDFTITLNIDVPVLLPIPVGTSVWQSAQNYQVIIHRR